MQEDYDEHERLDVLEFDSDRKRMSVIVQSPKGDIRLVTKGRVKSPVELSKNSIFYEVPNSFQGDQKTVSFQNYIYIVLLCTAKILKAIIQSLS